jgi:signal transduction histidine kinase
VAGDAQALETAVLNLLDNAVKYSRERVRIELEVWGDATGRPTCASATRASG